MSTEKSRVLSVRFLFFFGQFRINFDVDDSRIQCKFPLPLLCETDEMNFETARCQFTLAIFKRYCLWVKNWRLSVHLATPIVQHLAEGSPGRITSSRRTRDAKKYFHQQPSTVVDTMRHRANVHFSQRLRTLSTTRMANLNKYTTQNRIIALSMSLTRLSISDICVDTAFLSDW